MPKSKARKTGFEIAHVDIGEGDTAWVYKSRPTTPVMNAPRQSDTSVAAVPQRPSASQSIDESHRWMETGARVLVFPLACALVAVAAPVIWMVASRDRE